MRRFPGLRVAAVHDVPRLDSRYRDQEGRPGSTWVYAMAAALRSVLWLCILFQEVYTLLQCVYTLFNNVSGS